MAATGESTERTSVCINLGLKWTLKAKELKDLMFGRVSVVHSDQYEFKLIKHLRFYFKLECVLTYSRGIKMTVKGSKIWSSQLQYSFIVSNERAFLLHGVEMPSFLNPFEFRHLPNNEEYVEIHCVLNFSPIHPIPDAVKDKVVLLKNQKVVELQSVSIPKHYTNGHALDFIQKGDIPEFTTDMAIKIIAETEIHKCQLLKILCMEYLITFSYPDNMQQILQTAIDYNLPHLERSCRDKIAASDFLKYVPPS